jgi:hexokinase
MSDTFNPFFIFRRDALTGSNTSTIRVFDKFNYKLNVDYDDDDIKVIQYATALVSYRAALLVSICSAVLLNRMSEKEITIAVDGSVYKHHPRLKKWMKQLIKELAPEKEVSAIPLLITLSLGFRAGGFKINLAEFKFNPRIKI